jgi:hypothetical protein
MSTIISVARLDRQRSRSFDQQRHNPPRSRRQSVAHGIDTPNENPRAPSIPAELTRRIEMNLRDLDGDSDRLNWSIVEDGAHQPKA